MLFRGAVVVLFFGLQIPVISKLAPSIRVVVARYDESLARLAWLVNYNHTIYSRGPQLSSIDSALGLNVVDDSLNVGRESYVYFSYIITNFMNLPDIIIFTQANMENVQIEKFRHVVHALSKGAQFSQENDGFAFTYNSCATSREHNHLRDLKAKYDEEANIIITGYISLLNYVVSNPRFSGRGQFAVKKENILRNDVHYYIKLQSTLRNSSDPVVGHFYERAWPEVFKSSCSAGVHFHCLWRSSISC